MISQENSTGKPLADIDWLEKHHKAKLQERTIFAEMLAKFSPQKIVDLGCASGLWLDLLDKIISNNSILIIYTSDHNQLNLD